MTQSDYTIRLTTADDAQAVVDCFRRTYGGRYANPIFNDPAALTAALEAGTLVSVIATHQGRVIAHMGMRRRHRTAVLAELGNTLVDPDQRGTGLAWQVGSRLTTLCREAGHLGFYHYPTLAHDVMQRQSVKQGFETGILYGYIPPASSGQQRTAATTVFEPFVEPATDFPERRLTRTGQHDELLERLISQTGVRRTWQEGRSAPPADRTEFNLTHESVRDRLLIEVTAIGEDLIERIEDADNGATVMHVDLPMSDPGLTQAIAKLEDHGLEFAAWLVEWRDGDVLRLQKVDSAHRERPQPANPVAQQIVGHIEDQRPR